MTDKERAKAFRKERTAQLRRLTTAHRKTAKQVKELLDKAHTRVTADLAAGSLSEFQAWQLPNIQQSVAQSMQEIGEQLAMAGAEGATATHAIGVEMVDRSLAAGGIRISGLMPDVDLRQLMAIRTFMTGRLKDVTAKVGRKVNTQIGLVMIGTQTTSEAVTGVAGLIKSSRGRATTIVRTEMGRAFSVATQERQAEASKHLPGLKKQWRRSGKLNSRVSHDIADGQIVDVKKPFIVGGVKLMYPRDPKAPAKDTVNCGCVSLPHMEKWDVKQPGRMPFTDEEVFRNPQKRDLARELNPPINQVAPGLSSIRNLERLSPAAARRQVAEDLRSEDFRAFLQQTGGARDHRAVGVMSDDLAKAFGTDSRTVRLSSYTAVKQRARRRGQAFGPSDYRRLQGMLDDGLVLREGKHHLVAFKKDGKNIWKAVVKKTGDSSEIYLQTMHRSNKGQMLRDSKKLELIRKK